jgi:hypothetical protein
MTKAPKKTKHAAKQRYDAKKTAAGEHVQINVKFKSAADVKMFKQLRDRFEGESDSGIVRMAVKKLSEDKN